MSTRRATLASTPVAFAVAMVAISACGGSSPPTGTAATPTFSPGAGAVNAGQKVTISTTTANATIFYTVDGTQPKTSVTGTTKKYTAPITIMAATTIKAVATASGFNPSTVASASYTISTVPLAATPSFNPPAGAVVAGTTVAISTTTPNATIYYTTDGTTPGTSSTQYTAPIAITAAVTIKAIAKASGFATSAVASAAYTLMPIPIAAMPTFSPAEGAVAAGSTVTISTTTAGATSITPPTERTPDPSLDRMYTAPIPITAAVTIKAVATAAGFDDSAVASAAYTLTVVPTAVAPTFNPAAGAVLAGTMVTISTTTAGATIRYTTDGTDPGPSSTQYTAPIAITAAVTIKAIATASGFADSAAGSAAYTILAPAATPTFDPEAGAVLSGTMVIISTTTAGATIRYTTDGTNPGPSSTQYTAPIAITTAVTIKAIGHGAGIHRLRQWDRPRTRSWLRRRRRRSARGREPSSPEPWSPSARRRPARRSVTRQTERTPDRRRRSTPRRLRSRRQSRSKPWPRRPGSPTPAVGSATYTILAPAATPTFSPLAGAVAAGTAVTISTTTANAMIFYTTDGTQPATSAGGSTQLYSAPVSITTATTINAIAVAPTFANSAVGSAAYTIMVLTAGSNADVQPGRRRGQLRNDRDDQLGDRRRDDLLHDRRHAAWNIGRRIDVAVQRAHRHHGGDHHQCHCCRLRLRSLRPWHRGSTP